MSEARSRPAGNGRAQLAEVSEKLAELEASIQAEKFDS
jgi:hypothetical protein